MPRRFLARLPLLAAAAVIAAALADPFVESVSNSGVFGGGYHDDNHLGVVPALLAGVMLAATVALLRCAGLWRRSRTSSHWLAQAGRAVATRPPLRDLPCVFALQALALYAIERCEALLAGGELTGLEWLGGPIAFSLIAHAFAGVLCTFLLGALLRATLRSFAALAYGVVHATWLAPVRAIGFAFHRFAAATLQPRAQSPHARQVGGRAPPPLPSPA